jgi:hypothetical protein
MCLIGPSDLFGTTTEPVGLVADDQIPTGVDQVAEALLYASSFSRDQPRRRSTGLIQEDPPGPLGRSAVRPCSDGSVRVRPCMLASGRSRSSGCGSPRLARLLFPGGVLVEGKPREHRPAMARTAALMADRSVPAIFEAAFEHSGVRVRVDVLERLSRGYWGIREVKSSGEVKDHHYDDVAVQVWRPRRPSVHAGKRPIEVVRVRITDAGRLALAG